MDDTKNTLIEAFESLFPDAHCELIHENPFQLLIAVMLSAQTTDVAVNQVTPALFARFPDCESLAHGDLEKIEGYIKRIGLYKTKAKNIQATSRILLEQYHGQVPNSREALMQLPGVGRKTANVVLSVAFNEPAFAVDTHVERISKRLGLADPKDDALMVEKKVTAIFPKTMWNKLHHQMIFFGRYHCTAKKPNCHACPLFNLCQFEDKEKFR